MSGFRERINNAKHVVAKLLRPETPIARAERIERSIQGGQEDARDFPEFGPFMHRYGELAGHAIALQRREGALAYTEDRRVIIDSAAKKFRSALETGNFETAESAYRLSLDLSTGSVPQIPPEQA